MGKQIGEIFEELYKAKPKEKATILKKHDSKVLRELLKLNFDSKSYFDLPEGEPPYKKSTELSGMDYTTLNMEWKRMPLFMRGLSKVNNMKREFLFISLLEALDKVEANILCEIKDKKLKGVTKAQVNEAFPGLIK